MDFGTLPPEINSGRMFSGLGAGSILAAGAAWDRLAGEVYDVAAAYDSMAARMADGGRGAAATAIGETAARHIEWLRATAAHAKQTAAMATTSADAYQTAVAAMVPPALIVANRASRKPLVATNCLGQCAPAIASAEAQYEKMWVQDAAAMYAYADASAAATTMPSVTSPPTVAGPPSRGPGAPEDTSTEAPAMSREVISAAGQVISLLPQALKGLSSASPQRFDATILSMSAPLSKLSSLRLGFAKDASVPIAVAIMGAAMGVNVHRSAVIAGFGRGASIGSLSVPHSWFASRTAGRSAPEVRSAAEATGRWVSGQQPPRPR